MKILWIAPIKHPKTMGHPAPWIEELANNISQHIELTILGHSAQNHNMVEIFDEGRLTKVFLKTLRPKLDVLTLKQFKIAAFKKWLNQNALSFDLIHIHGNEHQFEVACRSIELPKVLSVQGIISECLKYYRPEGFQLIGWKISAYYEKKYYDKIHNYSCRTHWDQKIVKQNNPNARVFKIWETIRKDFFIREPLSKGDNILFIGGKQKIKGIDYALQAYSIIKEEINGKLLIGGSASKTNILQLIQAHRLNIDIDNDIEILGFLDVQGLIQHAKRSFCFLHPTLIDNSPNSVCEAQVMGLPVVATDVGGVASLIENNETGILTNHDINNISEKIIFLYKNNELWQRISNRSREVSRERHDPDRIVNQTIKMYKQILSIDA